MRKILNKTELEEGMSVSLRCLQFIQFVLKDAGMPKLEATARRLHDDILVSTLRAPHNNSDKPPKKEPHPCKPRRDRAVAVAQPEELIISTRIFQPQPQRTEFQYAGVEGPTKAI